jgi:F0F1-type ATP synthase membrane subunit b/b'
MLADTMFLGVLMVLAALVLVLWVLMPFAVFGIKSRLDELIAEQRKAALAAQMLLEELRAARAAEPSGKHLRFR